MRNTATHRAPGRSITPLGTLPKARSVVGGFMLAGFLSTGAAATATAAPTWPTCDGDGISNNCPPLGEATSAAPTWPSCDGDGIPDNCPPLGEAAPAATTAEPTWPSCDGDGIPDNCPPLGEVADTSSDSGALPAGATAVTASMTSSSASGIVDAAHQAIGTDYAWGGESLSGMDCSGLIHWAYEQAGVSLDGNRTADQIMTGGQSISVSAAQPGDIVGYKTGGGGYSHAGIYVGNGQIIDASGSQGVVVERGMWGEDWDAVSYR